MTQEQLGDLIDTPRNTIARWERDELPIAKARQLELALSAILRPEVARSFKIVFSEENEGEGDLECGFCGRVVPVLYRTQRDTAGQIIHEHYTPDFDDDTLKVSQCPNRHRWKSSTWELLNADNDAVVSRGVVRMTKSGIEVEVTSESQNPRDKAAKRG